MSVPWHALNARARGLGTRLIDDRHWEALRHAPDPAALADGLRAIGYGMPAGGSPVELDRSISRTAAARLGVLARWAPHPGALAVVFDDEDRRSLRVLLRGAVAGAAPSARLLGIVPTPTLPRRALEVLATAGSARAVADRLTAQGHVLAPALDRALAGAGPGLLGVEVALCRAFAERARRLTRWGARPLRAHVATVVDLENAWSILLVTPADEEEGGADLFVAGGTRLGRDRFLAALRHPEQAERRRALAAAFAGTSFGAVFAGTVPLPQLEEKLLDAQIAEQRRAAMLDPLGPAPVLAYVLGLRAEAARLRRLVWRSVLDRPLRGAGASGARP